MPFYDIIVKQENYSNNEILLNQNIYNEVKEFQEKTKKFF